MVPKRQYHYRTTGKVPGLISSEGEYDLYCVFHIEKEWSEQARQGAASLRLHAVIFNLSCQLG